MTRKATWVIPVAALAMTGWLFSLSLAEPRERRRSDADHRRAERRERDEKREHREREEREERERGEERRELEEQERGIHELGLHMRMLESMSKMAFDPIHCAMIAIGAIKDDLDMEPKEAAEHLEKILEETKTLGLRSAIRMSLKELYEETDDREAMLRILKAQIRESDKAIQEHEARERKK
jgi:hypothetical protein